MVMLSYPGDKDLASLNKVIKNLIITIVIKFFGDNRKILKNVLTSVYKSL